MERVLMELEDLVYDELKKIVKQKDISPVELDNATKAVCLLLKMDELKSGSYEEEGYSNRMMPRRMHSNSYMNGVTYSNGYRDGMYITPAMDRYSNTYYGNDGYSRHSIKDRAIDKLERMMDEAKSESEKDAVRKMIGGLEHMELY